jgi:hypothetical protein
MQTKETTMLTDNKTLFGFAPESFKEHEVTVRLNRTTGLAHIASCCPSWTARLAKRYGLPRQAVLSQPSGTIVWAIWELPIGLVTLRKPGWSRRRKLAGIVKVAWVREAGHEQRKHNARARRP